MLLPRKGRAEITMPILTPDQEKKPKRPVLEVLFAIALMMVGLVALAVVGVIVAVYATGGSVFIIPHPHAPHP